jgi:superfamily II DNA or RNA helicase
MQRDLFEELKEIVSGPVAPVEVESDIILRPYQVESVDQIFEAFETKRSTLLCLPTGCGKSVVFSNVMKRFREENQTSRAMVLAHRDELCWQAMAHADNAGLTAGMEKAGWVAGREAIIVSSIQTQSKVSKCKDCMGEGCDFCDGIGKVARMQKFDPFKFGLLIIDEAHHATANTYRMVIDWYQRNPNLKLLLVTATPKRSDKIGLHNVCESVAYEMQLKEAIDAGWLVPIKQRFIHVDSLDLSKVKTTAGDMQASGVARAFLGDCDEDEERLLHAIAKPTLEQADGQPVLVFSASQEHAAKLTAAFRAYDGVTAEMVIDSTDPRERPKIIQRFKNGQTQVLVNCMVFTEGFDAPKTAIIANARPTKSESLYLQIIGRGTRPLAGVVDGPETAEERKAAIAESDKPHCVILDFVGNSGRHKITSVFDLLAGDDCDPLDLETALKEAEAADSEVDVEELIEKAKTEREERERIAEEERLIESTRHHATRASYEAIEVDLFGHSGWRVSSPAVDPGAVKVPGGSMKGKRIKDVPSDWLECVENQNYSNNKFRFELERYRRSLGQ